ncbi:unnamed protein product [Auanema sp. JU1783]|nr:unnamed protein product [Auanema sp. JU1783]
MLRLLLLLFSMFPLLTSMRSQSYAVRGRLICGPSPSTNVRVKLWEADRGDDPDDLLDTTHTDSNGEFVLSGFTSELTTIDPQIRIYHNCNDENKFGKRRVKFLLPKSYISDGRTPKKEYDLGIINLETSYPLEDRDIMN